ncbi:hypothetical protein WA026_020736 [Henosepilachna vigintioctopunctata]|uniref:Uncharacterized protein n=2 Tax=Henosepilachna vigintioctopunctata TaxID=420089 RepID=A0AAW1UBU5_9CUCU
MVEGAILDTIQHRKDLVDKFKTNFPAVYEELMLIPSKKWVLSGQIVAGLSGEMEQYGDIEVYIFDIENFSYLENHFRREHFNIWSPTSPAEFMFHTSKFFMFHTSKFFILSNRINRLKVILVDMNIEEFSNLFLVNIFCFTDKQFTSRISKKSLHLHSGYYINIKQGNQNIFDTRCIKISNNPESLKMLTLREISTSFSVDDIGKNPLILHMFHKKMTNLYGY